LVESSIPIGIFIKKNEIKITNKNRFVMLATNNTTKNCSRERKQIRSIVDLKKVRENEILSNPLQFA
jgi:hypothetical protein